ncbi:hypothetical protein MJM59_28690, partial [Salmonella enterica subsp. enterica serovar Montevideo]|nr:hypothetical protein [Salmonella enterica subsp. enterica serovar Montevideo]
MAAQGFLLIASFLLILLVLAKPLGSGLARMRRRVSGAITGYLLCHGWLRDGRRQIVSADPVNIQTVVVGFSP